MKLITVFIIALSLSGCDAPTHKVYGTDLLKVYSVEEISDSKYGKYRYYITDGSGQGWQLKTDTKFEIGDHLEIAKKGDNK